MKIFCEKCNGRGYNHIDGSLCKICEGDGYIEENIKNIIKGDEKTKKLIELGRAYSQAWSKGLIMCDVYGDYVENTYTENEILEMFENK